MTTIEVRFPANRFHANPWGRHVNEGVAEWPPSPYRLLRALYDAWKRKHPELPQETVARVFRALSREVPRFQLPKAVASHTRSYLSNNTVDPTDKSLIFDSFVAVDPDAACYVSWPGTSLDAEERSALDRLLHSLNYIGRSESWVAVRRVESTAIGGLECAPAETGVGGGELIPIACVVPESEYHEKRPWMDALAYSTSDLLKERRSGPPVMRMVQYVRPEGAVVSHVSKRPRRTSPCVGAVLLALDGAVLPLVTATVEIAEQIRVRLMGIHKRVMADPTLVSPKFSGKSPDGQPLVGHQHIFILPIGNSRGRIDRVLLYTRAPSGFDEQEMRAILGLRTLYQHDRDHPVHTVVTWKGPVDDPHVRRGTNTAISKTPFVTTRHWRKGRGTPAEFLAAEVQRECRQQGLPEPKAVELLERAPGLFEWIEFRRNRKDDPPHAGYGFRLRFQETVAAPFALGYACHFGLGQFDVE
jgi:CRISPR-associated protein Csb2